MSGGQMDRLEEQMQRLKLVRTATELPLLLQEASKRELSYSELLEEIFSRELAAKQERHTVMKTTMARFPFQKSLDSFDFKFQPSIDPKVIRELATGRFIADADNVLLLGPPGVGKTHLAVGLGLKACALGYRTAFTTAAGLIATLTRAHQENRLDEKLKQLVQPKLLILDLCGVPGYVELAPRPRVGRGACGYPTPHNLAPSGALIAPRATPGSKRLNAKQPRLARCQRPARPARLRCASSPGRQRYSG